ncbi:sensor histidine kinase [Weissella soli]|uniref:sensor histidine kinase n=1 Tax=Weissella soli TaxID=155866 RepID=UPI003EF966DA
MKKFRPYIVFAVLCIITILSGLLIIGWEPGAKLMISSTELVLFVFTLVIGLTIVLYVRQARRNQQMQLFIQKLQTLQDDGSTQAHIFLHPADDLFPLATAVNNVQSLQRHQIKNLERQETALNALLTNMPVAAIQITPEREILRFNTRAANLLNLSMKSVGRTYDDLILSHSLLDFFERAIRQKTHLHETIAVEQGNQTRWYDTTAEYYHTQANEYALWILFYDLTELIDLQERQTQFVANASHELRTPLTSIAGFTETLLSGAQEDPAARQQFLEIIQKETNRLLALVQDILSLAKIGNKTNATETLGVREIVEDVLLSQQDMIRSQGYDVSVDIPETEALSLPAGSLRQIISNLIINSLKYNRPQGKLHVQSMLTDDQVVLTFADTGLGISSEDQAHIFERFYRADKSRNQQISGTGLGLSIVYELVTAVEGQVELDSQLSVGTTITVRFPIQVLASTKYSFAN